MSVVTKRSRHRLVTNSRSSSGVEKVVWVVVEEEMEDGGVVWVVCFGER